MKEIKDKKVYKVSTTVSSRYRFLETEKLISNWELEYGDTILIGEEAKKQLIERLHSDVESFYRTSGLTEKDVVFGFYPHEGNDGLSFWSVIVIERSRTCYWLGIEEPCNGVYVEDEEEEGGEE